MININHPATRRVLKVLLSIFLIGGDIPFSANEFVKKVGESKRKNFIMILTLISWVSLLTLIFLSVNFFNNTNTLFNVVAVTEKIEVSAYKSIQFPEWLLKNAVLYNDCDSASSIVSGNLHVNKGATIDFLRMGAGKLYITLNSDEIDTVGKIEGYAEVLSDCAVLELSPDSGRSFTFPIDGVVKLGGEVMESVERMPILLEGKINIADKALLSQEYYLAEPHDLTFGDKFSIRDQIVQSSGFVLIDENPGMKVTYASKGSVGIIERYKTESIQLKNSFWTKLFNDETIVLLWVLLGAIYAFFKISIRFCIE